MSKTRLNLVDRRFGRLVAQSDVGSDPDNRSRLWLCSCDCGGEKVARTNDLIREVVRSCGCLGDDPTTPRPVPVIAPNGQRYRSMSEAARHSGVGSGTILRWLRKPGTGWLYGDPADSLPTRPNPRDPGTRAARAPYQRDPQYLRLAEPGDMREPTDAADEVPVA